MLCRFSKLQAEASRAQDQGRQQWVGCVTGEAVPPDSATAACRSSHSTSRKPGTIAGKTKPTWSHGRPARGCCPRWAALPTAAAQPWGAARGSCQCRPPIRSGWAATGGGRAAEGWGACEAQREGGRTQWLMLSDTACNKVNHMCCNKFNELHTRRTTRARIPPSPAPAPGAACIAACPQPAAAGASSAS